MEGMNIILFFVAAVSPLPVDNVTRCDVIEFNHFINENTGEVILEQWLFWDRDPWNNYQIVSWRMVVKGKGPDGQQVPVLKSRVRKVGDMYEFTTARDQRLWHVQAPEYRETWTLVDPEVANRSSWPQRLRRGLEGEKSVQVLVDSISPLEEKKDEDSTE